MKWKLTLAQKIRAGGALLVVFLLVLATNMMDRHHFEIVQRSLTTIYEDRLVAKDYLYKVSRQIQIKRNAMMSDDKELIDSVNQEANDSIQTLLSKYATTRLTEKEVFHYGLLQSNLDKLYRYEKSPQYDEVLSKELPSIDVAESYYLAIITDLDALFEIQLKEGKREINFSSRAIDTSNLISRLEIGTLILIGIMIQLLIFLKPLK